MVLVFAGTVGASAGPVPYDMEECLSRAAEMNQILTENFKKMPEIDMDDGRKITRKDLQYHCLEQEERPVLESTAPENLLGPKYEE